VTTPNRHTLSLVIPAYNEVESLPSLHKGIVAVLEDLGLPFEVLYVDDGSNDGLLKALEDLFADDPRVRVISFRRNHGKSAALSVGFAAARGSLILTMDADGQDEPSEIPRLIEAIDSGLDVVVGWKYPRLDPPTKVAASRVFNGVVGWATGIYLHDMNCGLKVLRREVAETVPIYGELHRFLVPLAHLNGFRCAELQVTHHPRRFGQSKFGMRRYLEGAFDLVTILFLSHFQVRPMHLFGTAGAGLFSLGMLVNLYLSVLWFGGQPLGNRPLLFFGMLLCIVGVQLFSTGLIGEMLARVSAKNRDYPLRKRLDQKTLPEQPEEPS
jgi:glycosyltransferase involved in cell wall biosynthesis